MVITFIMLTSKLPVYNLSYSDFKQFLGWETKIC